VSASANSASLAVWPECPAVIVEVFGETAAAACTVAHCESTYRPGATNGMFLGLFQIGPPYHHDKLTRLYAAGAVANEDYFDPHTNTVLAYDITAGGRDWSQFSCKP